MKIILSNKNEKDRREIEKIKSYYGHKTESKALKSLIYDFDKLEEILNENKRLKIKLSLICCNSR